MSVCSGLDQIEDFLLSSAAPMTIHSGSYLGNSSTNTSRFMGPPIASGNLNGLNLSLNHGLDLTSPTYGCLNLTQSSQQHQQQPQNPPRQDPSILNLTQQQIHHQSNHNSFNNRSNINNERKETCEVGLNLSLQNGMNLTRQAYYYNEGDFDYQSSGFEHNSTSTQHRSSDQSAIIMPHEAHHRYSPLNLEHRSSPLNLTHSRCNSKYDQNQYFNFSQDGVYQNYNSTNELLSYSSSNTQTPQQQPSNYYYEPSNLQQQQHYSTTGNYNSQQNAKIRLFCSTCSQEFATSNELNKHMEKHNSQLENVETSINSATSIPYTTNSNKNFYPNKSYRNSVAATTTSSSSEFQVQDSFDNVMNFSCEKLPPATTTTATATTKSQPSITASEKVKLPPEMPIINAPNNSTKKKIFDEPKSICSECGMAFPTGVDLKKHIDLAHKGRQGGKKYQCIQCAEEFDEIQSHKQHMENHIQEKPFKCQKCGLHLTNASGLKRHIRRIHDKIAPVHECPHKNCSKGFHEKFDLSRHLKTHSAPRCDKCRKLLPGKDKKHICKPPDGEKDPDLKCTICGIYLDTKVKWGFHMWKHTKDPAYIQTRSTVIQKQLVNPLSEEPICLKSKHAANSNSVLQEVKS